MHSRIATWKLHIDGCPAEVGAHSEVSDGCRASHASGDVAEDAISSGFQTGGSNDAECGDAHDGADGVIQVGAMGSYGDGDRFVIDDVRVLGDGIVSATHFFRESVVRSSLVIMWVVVDIRRKEDMYNGGREIRREDTLLSYLIVCDLRGSM